MQQGVVAVRNMAFILVESDNTGTQIKYHTQIPNCGSYEVVCGSWYCVAEQLTSTFLIKNTNYEIVKLKICMLDLFIDTYYLSSVNINLIIDYYGTLENSPNFLEKCKMDVSCFSIQKWEFNYSCFSNLL